MSEQLRPWLSEEIDRRGWSHSELARRAEVSQATISRILSGERSAGAEFCVKIALVFNESPERILRLAEILPPIAPEDETTQELIELIKHLSPAQREEVLRYTRYIYHSDDE